MSLGTAWVGNFSLPEGTKWRSPSQLVLAPLIGRGWFVVQPLTTGNVAWDWALRQFVGRDHREALRKAARIFEEELLPPEGLTALPWVNAPNPLKPGTHGGGAFIGLSPRVGEADLLRAMAASMSFEMARIFRPALESKAIDSIVLGGGAAQGAFFQTLMAVLFDPLPIRLAAEPDLAGARGSLHAFGGPASGGRTRRVGRPAAGLRDRVERQFQQYLTVIKRLLGKDYLSGGLQIERKGVHK
jgi:sugar (pentulose or hexulose) kinase